MLREEAERKAKIGSNGLKRDDFRRFTGAMVGGWTPEFEGQFFSI
jgi:hypothetical protein